MKKYTLIDEPSKDCVKTTFQMRQNPWQKLNNSIKLVKDTKKVHTPWGHTQSQVTLYSQNKENYLSKCHKFTKNSLQLKVGDVGIVEGDGGVAIVVKITSSPKCGVMDEIVIARSERSCNHHYTQQGHDVGDSKGCTICSDSVKAVIRSNDIKEIQKAIQKGYIIEPFYSMYFDIEVLGKVDFNGKKKVIVPMTSFTNAVRYFSVSEMINPFDEF